MYKFYNFVIITILIMGGCSRSSTPTEPLWDSSIAGKAISSLPDQEFSLQLDVNADAGYQWDISLTDSNVVHVDSTHYRPKSGNYNQAGGITIETIYFCTRSIGQSTVTLVEHRGWEHGVPAIDSLAFTVRVIR